MLRINEAIWVQVPLFLQRVSNGLAVATTDGLYLCSFPIVGAIAPLVAVAAGVAIGVFHPGFNIVFTESLLLLVAIAFVGTISGALGLYLTVGFVFGDLFFVEHFRFYAVEQGLALFGKFGAFFLTYISFAFLAVGVPIAAKSLASEFILPARVSRPVRAFVALGAMVCLTGLLVYIWTTGAPLMVRPVFTTAGVNPDLEAIQVIQEQWRPIVVAAVLAALLRAIAQYWLATRSGTAQEVLTKFERRFQNAGPVDPLIGRQPLLFRLFLRAAFLTALLSGLYDAVWQPLVTMAALYLAQIAASPLLPLGSNAYGRFISRIPRLLRLGMAMLPVYLFGGKIVDYYIALGTTSFLPFLTLTLFSAVITTILMPSTNHRSEVKVGKAA